MGSTETTWGVSGSADVSTLQNSASMEVEVIAWIYLKCFIAEVFFGVNASYQVIFRLGCSLYWSYVNATVSHQTLYSSIAT